MQSKSLMDGKGLSIPQYFIDNLDKPVYDFTPLWPPGYPLLLAPFLKIFNYDVYWATTTLDIVVCVGFIFLVRSIAKQIGLPTVAVNIMTLAAGFFEYPFIFESLPTDTVSLTFFLAGFLMTIKLVQSEKISSGMLWLAGFLLFLPCFFRYAYPPISLAVPLCIMLAGWYMKQKIIVRKGAYLFVITALLITVLYLYQKLSTQQAGYILETERGFFPENMLRWYPFLPASFINLPFLTSQSLEHFGLEVKQTMAILEVINVLCVISLVIVFILLFIKKKFNAPQNAFTWFLLTGFFVSLAVCGSLGYLSLTHAEQRRFTYVWNYIYEARYYAFIFVFAQLAFLGWVFLDDSWKKNLFFRSVITVFSLVFLIEITHNIYFDTKLALDFKKYKSAYYKEEDYVYFNAMLDSVISRNPDAEVLVFSDNDHYYPYRAAYVGKKGVFDGINLNQRLPAVTQKTIILLMLYKDEVPAYENFLTRNDVKLLNRVAFSNFYLLELNP